MAQQTALSVLGVPGQTQSFVAKEEAAAAGTLSVTAMSRDYVKTAEKRFPATVSVVLPDLFVLSNGNYLLLSDGNDLAIRGGSSIESPLLTARNRDYVMTAPERE